MKNVNSDNIQTEKENSLKISGGKFGFGQCCEGAAADYLKSKGYELIFRNYRVKGGEIDLIMKKENILAFIEVKARAKTDNIRRFGRPGAAVNYQKRRHIIYAAEDYLRTHPKIGQPRMDVIEVYYEVFDDCIALEFNHIINAFTK